MAKNTPTLICNVVKSKKYDSKCYNVSLKIGERNIILSWDKYLVCELLDITISKLYELDFGSYTV